MSLEQVPEKSVSLFCHLLNAHHIWNARAHGTKEIYGLFQEHAIKSWSDIQNENQKNSTQLITNSDDFQKLINYKNSKGKFFANTLQEVLFHIINHSTHHRGQMIMDFRSSGLQPPSLDYINYKR